MKRYSDRKIIIIKRSTRLEEMIKRFNTIEQAKFYITALDGDFEDYLIEDKQYNESLRKVVLELEPIGNTQVIHRDFVSNFVFGEEDIVVAIGQDGMVANVLKYLNRQPLVGVNPDKGRWDGVLLPFEPKDCGKVIMNIIKGVYTTKEVTMAKVILNDGQILYAVNDFYIGHKSHVSFRYGISQDSSTERQSSSGIIVSTGLGSTGWMKSVLTGASCIINKLTGSHFDFASEQHMAWDTNRLMYSVREPYASNNTGATIGFGFIDKTSELSIQSFTAENGVIFSDGIESDYLEFNSGITATFTVAEKKGLLVC